MNIFKIKICTNACSSHFFSLRKCFVGKILAGNWFTKLSSIIIVPSSIFVLIKQLKILFNFKIKWPILSTLFCKKNAFLFLTSRLEIKYIFYWLGWLAILLSCKTLIWLIAYNYCHWIMLLANIQHQRYSHYITWYWMDIRSF